MLLGIDIGTSGCKVCLFDFNGNIISKDTQPYKVYYKQEGYAEQDPKEWFFAVCDAVKNVLAQSKVDPKDIAGIGVDGQSWSAIPIDEKGEVLCNTPIWFDVRAKDICTKYNKEIGADNIFNLCGNSLQPSYSTPKIIWYKENLPDIYNKTKTILQSNSYIVYMLTGKISQDVCQGYGLHFFNMKKLSYDADFIKAFGLNADMFPPIFKCHDVVGKVTKSASALTGLLEGTPVVAGGLDAACGSLGAGVIDEGETQEQGGQAGGMSIALKKYVADKRLILSTHVIPHTYLLQGGTVGGGGVMRWMAQEFGDAEKAISEQTHENFFDLLTKKAQAVGAGSDGMVFLPYMAGERSPIWNPKAKGVFYGVDYRKTKGHFIRCAMEGVVFSLKHNVETAKEAGAEINKFYAIGGSANSHFWTQIKADVTQKTFVVPYADEATTLGAAILAGVGTGVYKDFYEAREKTLRINREQTPSTADLNAYNEGYRQYIELYGILSKVMQ